MNLIDLTDKALMKILLSRMQHFNPKIQIGEQLTGPLGLVQYGKLADNSMATHPPKNLVQMKYKPEFSGERPHKVESVTSVGVQMKLDDIAYGDVFEQKLSEMEFAEFDFGNAPLFVYPYMLHIPSRDWLETYKLGDIISLAYMDEETFVPTYVQTPLTQQMINENSDVLFKFAVSKR